MNPNMSPTEQDSSASTLKEIGAELASARIERGTSVADVASSLHLLPAFIEAIESGDMDALPSATYVVGYVRSYAGFLGLDANDLCQRLHASLSDEQVRPEYTFIENKFARRGGAGRMALAALALMTLGYGGWYALYAGFLGPEEEPLLLETVETVLTETPDPAPGADTPGNAAVTPEGAADAAPEAEEGIPPFPSDGPDATGDLSGSVGGADGVGLDGSQEEPEASPQVGQAVAHNRNPDTEMVIKALATSWVEISRPDGSVVSAWLMREGDEYIVPGDEDIYLTAGNAGGLEISISGSEAVKLGEWGETVSELPLDPAILSDGN